MCAGVRPGRADVKSGLVLKASFRPTRSPPCTVAPSWRASAKAVCMPQTRHRRSAGRPGCLPRAGRPRHVGVDLGELRARAGRTRCRAQTGGAAWCSAGRLCPWRRRRCRAGSDPGRHWGATMAALLPPSSKMARAKRAAKRGATLRPMAVEPVAERTLTRWSSTSTSPISRWPMSSSSKPAGASFAMSVELCDST